MFPRPTGPSTARPRGGRGPRRRDISPVWWLCAALVAALAWPSSPVAAQTGMAGAAFVRVPAVSQLDVEPSGGAVVSTATGAESTGVVRIRVRANQAWRVVMATAAGEATVWVRIPGAGGGEYQRLEPGVEMVVAVGERGESVVEMAYRVEGETTASLTVLPVTYTLASL